MVPFQLPNSQLTGQVSTRLFTVPGFPGSFIAPDITVDLTAAQTLQISAQWSVNNASNTSAEELFEVSAVNV